MPYKDQMEPRAKAARARWLAKPGNKEKDRTRRLAYCKRWHIANREAVKEKKRRYYEQNRERELERSKEHKRRQATNKEVLAGRPRPAVCDACGKPPGKRGLQFDHSHAQGHFRGWLCIKCNLVLGQVGDDVPWLLKLIAYVRRTKIGNDPQLSLPGM